MVDKLGVEINFLNVLFYLYIDLVFEGFYFVKEYNKGYEYNICIF